LGDIVDDGPFLGVEQQTDEFITVAPGLCIGAESQNELFNVLIEKYTESHFFNSDGSLCLKNVVEITTEVLQGYGLKNVDQIQTCCGFSIYPKDYFCPIDYTTRELKITDNTRTIHHYAESWLPRTTKIKNFIGIIVGKRGMAMLVIIKTMLNRTIR
jgi:hypothetical protein